MKFLGENVKKENVMFLNSMYIDAKAGEGKDYSCIIYKDLKTGEKKLHVTPNPEMDIFFTKEEFRDYSHNLQHIESYKVEQHTVPYRSLISYIAKHGGPEYQNYIKRCIDNKNWGAINEIHKYPYVFGSDYVYDNFIRIQWLLHNDHDKPKPITKQFLDIETDIIDIKGFPKDGNCPINAVTMVDEKDMKCYTFLLRNPKNPLIQEFEDTVDDFIDELHEAFDETYGELEYNIYMYDEQDEGEMLKDLFRLINLLKRDFMLIWNHTFDIPFIIARFKVLGLDPEVYMCHNDFPARILNFVYDKNNKDWKNKSDYFNISSYTTFLDQMSSYAGLRKGMGERRSYGLTDVARDEIGDTKLDYDEESNLKTLPYVNYKKFVMYNIKDVLLQLGIERKTGDIDNLYQRSYTNATPYNKIFRQTVFIKSRAFVDYYKIGYILGNNANIQYGKRRDEEKSKDDKFDGALVSDPMLNGCNGIKVMGVPSMFIYDNSVDFDFKSMYPFVIIAFNNSPASMIGKLIIDKDNSIIYTEEFIEEHQLEDLGKDFIDNYLIGNVANMGSKWFGLPTFLEINKRIQEHFGINKFKVIDMSPSDYSMVYVDKITIGVEE